VPVHVVASLGVQTNDSGALELRVLDELAEVSFGLEEVQGLRGEPVFPLLTNLIKDHIIVIIELHHVDWVELMVARDGDHRDVGEMEV
jgi:hypothetical protein